MSDTVQDPDTDSRWQFWIDRGGTFTDIVAVSPSGEIATSKHLSNNPEAYDDAALHGIRKAMDLDSCSPIPVDRIAAVKMGTTVATNALLERKGQSTAFVTSKGLRDVVAIGHQARPDTFALNIAKPDVLYDQVIEIDERIRSDGSIERPVDLDDARKKLSTVFAAGYRSIAIALMHGYKYPAHEQRLGELARELGFEQISISHEVSPLAKLVPRAETTIVDAYLTPILRRYIDRVEAELGSSDDNSKLLFMQSSGGLTTADRFRGRDAILSGPAGGIVGCVRTAKHAGFEKVIGFDMGGTSTDVSHFAGAYEKRYETEVAGTRMRVPMLHIHTVAAGGGSIVRYERGRFRVGPESAGANPGPVCYRRGGPLAVTDINVCLGKLNADIFPQIFGPDQDMPLDPEASKAGFQAIADTINDGRSAEQVAEGFLQVAVEHMAQAIKQISLARGYDTKDYVMNCFGGAGGQHACLVAERLGISKILLHPFAGVLSAYGMGLAPVQTERQLGIGKPLDASLSLELDEHTQRLEQQCSRELLEQGVERSQQRFETSVLLRYAGTDTTISIALTNPSRMAQDFEREHVRQYGFSAPSKALVLDTLIVEGKSETGDEPKLRRPEGKANGVPREITSFYSKGAWHQAPVLPLQELDVGSTIVGPAIIVEPNGTIIVEPGWKGEIDRHRNLILFADEPVAIDLTDRESVDPVTLELFNNRYMSIAEQMGIVLRNTSQSVNVKERLDFSCAIFDPRGNLVANAPHVPVHLGSMDATVQTVIESGQAIMPGDAFVQNNPHNGGSHLPDITVVSPVFDEDDDNILFFVASRAHHEDIGGLSPGSMSPFGQTLEDEGIVLDNLKLVEGGVFQYDRIEQVLAAGSHPARNISQNIADLMAQVAANSTGASELRKLAQDFGLSLVHTYMDHIQDNAAEAVESALATLSDGAAIVKLDSGAEVRVAVRIDPKRRIATVDFTGTSEQQGNAFNAPRAVTRAALLYAVRCLIADDIPLNAGCMRPIELIIPEGCMLSPLPPAAVVAGNVETSQAVTDALFSAFGVLGAAQGTMNNLTFGNDRYQYYETICSGAPAGPGFDGAHAVHTHMTNTRMTDPEILEQRFPVLLEAFSIDVGSGGQGRWNAGDGVTRRIRFLDSMRCSILSDHRIVAPSGAQGGLPGRVGSNSIERADGSCFNLGGCGEAAVDPGDCVVIKTPTGGGFGAPVVQERESEAR